MPDTHDEDAAAETLSEDRTDESAEDTADESVTAPEDDDEASAPKRRRRFFSGRKTADVKVPDYDIRICTLDDLENFDADAYIHPEIVRSWLALQQFGEATVLVMWHKENTPAGTALISWTGDWNDEIRKKLKGVPAICNLHVDDAHRGNHIGRKLVAAAEKLVEGSGYEKITMSVPEDNNEALELYDKLGYKDSGLHSKTTYTYRDAEGKNKKATDRTIALVKAF
ncbi:ribosomal protein S18 acetylase RimI-like enzyme [Antricoccus suffuscus]|uniref:Ribosomal protein S18 acetylase RimI-like enzyme n=1 Tax=Antricoccus suffuscus TaxID=1629062 RepID=A0A2T0ZY82_9ACTN|nr:GNAT family N-acetyltransferase [Antricoccus suffuscus]PRZ41293.1 ribosomal protein S18 acetylase RimI-like enzyme [Antricoccus suffuscus]